MQPTSLSDACIAQAKPYLHSSANAKSVKKKFSAQLMREGAGYVVRRAIGGTQLSEDESDPFIVLDELPLCVFKPGENPGAPMHPRIGIITACYIKEGEWGFEFEDGRELLTAGDCEWVHTGSGLYLAEGGNHPGGPLHAFQCFVNLKSRGKSKPPSFQKAQVYRGQCNEEVSVRVVAGECAGIGTAYEPATEIQILDFSAKPGGAFEHTLPKEMRTALVYVYKGIFSIGPQNVKASDGEVCLLERQGASVWFQNVGNEEGGMLFVAGEPIMEPICRSGSIVLNSRQKLIQAVLDLKNKAAKSVL